MKGDIFEKHKWSPLNTSDLDADDWEVALLGSAGGGPAIGIGYFVFAFRSTSLRQYMRFWFVGAGITGGIFGGAEIDEGIRSFDCSNASWHALKPDIPEPFSASNLCRANGRIGIISAATPGEAGYGYTKLILTAVYSGPKRQGYLFDRFHLDGWGLGTGGLAGGVLWGTWVLHSVPAPHELDSDWTKPVCEIASPG